MGLVGGMAPVALVAEVVVVAVVALVPGPADVGGSAVVAGNPVVLPKNGLGMGPIVVGTLGARSVGVVVGWWWLIVRLNPGWHLWAP